MSQHIKSLIQQLHPFLTSKTPSPGSKPNKKSKNSDFNTSTANIFCLSTHKLKLNKNKTPSLKGNNHYYKNTPVTNQTPEQHKLAHEEITTKQIDNQDSGVDTTLVSMINTPLNTTKSKSCDCTRCKIRVTRRNQIEKTLKQAFSNYLKTPTEKCFANMPMLVVKSFQPTTRTLTNQLDQIEVRKGTAVNALFMNDNKWIYVKTASNQIGFIPKKCCEPFVNKKCKLNNIKLLEEFNTPLVRQQATSRSLADHTYMTINENELENLLNKKKVESSIEYINADSLDDELNYGNNQTDLGLFSVSNIAETSRLINKRITPEKLEHIHKFINSNQRVYIQNNSEKIKAKYLHISHNNNSRNSSLMIKMLKKSKSRNRKLSLALSNTTDAAHSLTMLEQENSCVQMYENLNDCCSKSVKRKKNYLKNTNISPIQEESFVCHDELLLRPKCKKELKFVYDNLVNFQSMKRAKYSNDESSSSSISSSYESYLSSPRQTTNNYDSLTQIQQTKNDYLNVNTIEYLNEDMLYSNNNDNDDDQHIYNHLSSNNSKILNMLKVVDDYQADFKDDLTVRKGDLVYLVEGSNKLNNSPDKNNSDWLFVRIYKRNLRADCSKFETNLVQGYVPRSHVVKI